MDKDLVLLVINQVLLIEIIMKMIFIQQKLNIINYTNYIIFKLKTIKIKEICQIIRTIVKLIFSKN